MLNLQASFAVVVVGCLILLAATDALAGGRSLDLRVTFDGAQPAALFIASTKPSHAETGTWELQRVLSGHIEVTGGPFRMSKLRRRGRDFAVRLKQAGTSVEVSLLTCRVTQGTKLSTTFPADNGRASVPRAWCLHDASTACTETWGPLECTLALPGETPILGGLGTLVRQVQQ